MQDELFIDITDDEPIIFTNPPKQTIPVVIPKPPKQIKKSCRRRNKSNVDKDQILLDYDMHEQEE